MTIEEKIAETVSFIAQASAGQFVHLALGNKDMSEKSKKIVEREVKILGELLKEL